MVRCDLKSEKVLPMKSKTLVDTPSYSLEQSRTAMLPPEAEKKMKAWIRSRHLICSGNFFIFQTVDYGTVERFSDCVSTLGGSVLSVEPIDKIWMGNHRQVYLYQAKASLHTPHHKLKQYWLKFGSFHTRFDNQP